MLEIIKTADGSNTIYNAEVGENYHSKHGALQESQHVFVNSGLKYFLSPTGGDLEGACISILEVGFGTGLNFLLSAELCAEKGIELNYTGIEAYPLSAQMISQTGYSQYLKPETWNSFIEKYPDSLKAGISIGTQCKLQIAHCKLHDFASAKHYDIIYFDAFAAAYQPEMWDEAAIAHTIGFLKPGGVFVTYAITGNLKRALKSLGCKVEKAPGAPGKREMLRAIKIL
ncbi:tRNA (5-methylaminomethyl-2-thiouridine)(34)-methyltransferase MnmD [Mucilaginibacter gotjawali]|uniref:tRNA 5-methylaminomethyl-2-thiouridine biosynthesis bifunctional protein MnmC n=2 Tax=Mucilaginibacter gotjawali TaxID=1550579 RepID=A0A0X8X4H1_9SPHI|nr:tRNA (5-methylaminomethyl-2-thiouridine)(34)-methyltransferase MnmD [Mucilaginibacter gotjawali]MBB3056233.1 tRNA U34 5-methylaminomethyl-2-thiouridine-forming methyltransferase MnmC [Mucilaginibacter gotjawali]BAU53424.1 tRNA 5-methylaminomethyl-2-thiouridine biosynthesis bifunctional protein MnmC [Mucilaginibacter gotjawali]